MSLFLMASEFGVSPWQYLTGEAPGSIMGATFDHYVWKVGDQARRQAAARARRGK